jgi:hypothetical protein
MLWSYIKQVPYTCLLSKSSKQVCIRRYSSIGSKRGQYRYTVGEYLHGRDLLLGKVVFSYRDYMHGMKEPT